jgi:Tol biopolymer transport system component
MADILALLSAFLLGVSGLLSTSAERQQAWKAPAQPSRSVFHQDVAWSRDGSKLLYSSNQQGDFEIWLADKDGSNPINLTRNPARDVYGVWSPDGMTIAFASNREGQDAIYLMKTDGSNVRRLTDPDNQSTFPTWSPDGRKIAFMSRRDQKPHLYVMNADGSNQSRLTSDDGDEENPQWSPDGSQILFESSREGSNQVYVMNPDGSHVSRLTTRGQNVFPGWSPDGSAVVYANRSDTEPANNGVYVMVLDDYRANPVNEKGFFARWSPDGRKLAVIEGHYPATSIIIMEPDGSGRAAINE